MPLQHPVPQTSLKSPASQATQDTGLVPLGTRPFRESCPSCPAHTHVSLSKREPHTQDDLVWKDTTLFRNFPSAYTLDGRPGDASWFSPLGERTGVKAVEGRGPLPPGMDSHCVKHGFSKKKGPQDHRPFSIQLTMLVSPSPTAL